MNLSLTDIDVPHEGTQFAWQVETTGYPMTVAMPNVSNGLVNVSPTATESATVVRVQAVPSSSRRTEVGWTLAVQQCTLGWPALRAPVPWGVVLRRVHLRLIVEVDDYYTNHRLVHCISVVKCAQRNGCKVGYGDSWTCDDATSQEQTVHYNIHGKVSISSLQQPLRHCGLFFFPLQRHSLHCSHLVVAPFKDFHCLFEGFEPSEASFSCAGTWYTVALTDNLHLAHCL
jgi:hypothetical protein